MINGTAGVVSSGRYSKTSGGPFYFGQGQVTGPLINQNTTNCTARTVYIAVTTTEGTSNLLIDLAATSFNAESSARSIALMSLSVFGAILSVFFF